MSYFKQAHSLLQRWLLILQQFWSLKWKKKPWVSWFFFHDNKTNIHLGWQYNSLKMSLRDQRMALFSTLSCVYISTYSISSCCTTQAAIVHCWSYTNVRFFFLNKRPGCVESDFFFFFSPQCHPLPQSPAWLLTLSLKSELNSHAALLLMGPCSGPDCVKTRSGREGVVKIKEPR